MNVRGAFLHVLNDAIGSIVLICAGLAMLRWPEKAWVHYIDPIASLVMLSMIVIFTIPLCKSSLDETVRRDGSVIFSEGIGSGSSSNCAHAHRSCRVAETTRQSGSRRFGRP